MASPWIPTERPPAERPWAGIALLVGVPLLSLILLRMLWSGSSLWFLLIGIVLIVVAAVLFFSRRPQGLEFDRGMLASDQARLPLILAGGGIIFLAMLFVPNFAGSDDQSSGDNSTSSDVLDDTASQPTDNASEMADGAPPAAPAPAVVDQTSPQTDADSAVDRSDLPEGYQVHVVASGDTLWAISETYGTTVEAIVSANNLANPEDLQLDQELIIPPPESSASADAAE